MAIQATCIGRYDSDSGRSKKAGEELVFAYGARTGAEVLVYRFPNLFGKWCRPNYNSAVATFCNNIACDLPITVNDPAVELELLYIDDLIDEMLCALEGKAHRCEFELAAINKKIIKYFLRRSIVVMTMVMLMFISGTSALLLSRYSSAGFLLVWPVLGDFVLPLCFVLLAQIFRNRICAVIAVLLAFASVILRITALIIRKETFMPLGMDSLQLLWEHADHNGLQAVFGRYYYFWMIPLAVLLVGAIIYFCARAWYASRNRRRIIPDSWITVFAVLFVISIAASTIYVFSQQRKVS